jgi:hypothetical protein
MNLNIILRQEMQIIILTATPEMSGSTVAAKYSLAVCRNNLHFYFVPKQKSM